MPTLILVPKNLGTYIKLSPAPLLHVVNVLSLWWWDCWLLHSELCQYLVFDPAEYKAQQAQAIYISWFAFQGEGGFRNLSLDVVKVKENDLWLNILCSMYTYNLLTCSSLYANSSKLE